MSGKLQWITSISHPSIPSLQTMAVLVTLTFACTPDDGSAPNVVRRDSANLVIVENLGSLPRDGGGWAVSEAPLLSIGSVEGEEPVQLYGVAGGHRLSDGRIAVVNAGSREVRIFARDGTHLVSYGRPGAGPEEFEAPVLAGTVDDTLLVVDRAQHRISYVHPDLGFVRLARVSDEVGGYLNPAGTFGNGETVFGGAFDMRRIEEVHNGMNRGHTFYRSSKPDGSLAVDFGDKLGAEFYIKDLEGSGQDSNPALIPFAKGPLATVSTGYLFFSDMDAWEIEVYRPSGEMVRIIRSRWDPIPVTPEDGERYVESIVAEMNDPGQASRIRQYFGSLPLPDHFPPFSNLMSDMEDHLWVQDYQRPGEENRAWTIFDEEGSMVGRVILPENFNPFEIGEDYVLGVGWDEMDVEYVRMYGLVRPREG